MLHCAPNDTEPGPFALTESGLGLPYYRAMAVKRVDSGAEVVLGRRERKKLATRRRLTDAAMELFKQRGYESVTVADIADQADVDQSTFFRIFGTKENVLFEDGEELAAVARAAFVARPTEEPVAESLAEVLGEVRGALRANRDLERLRIALGAESGDLRSRYLTQQAVVADAIRQEVSARTRRATHDAGPVIAAGAFVAALDWLRRHQAQSARAENSNLRSAQAALRLLDV